MEHFENIYANQAEAYQRMIAAEDVEGNLLKAMQQLIPLAGLHVIDVGSGTGRIPILLHPFTDQITCLDNSWAMLAENKRQSSTVDAPWSLVQADLVNLPFTSANADLITAGWAMGHFCAWYPQDWKTRMTAALHGMMRVLKPGGWLVIFETLGTGSLRPNPPNTDLAQYYAWLESDWGFTRQEISTDYQFATPEDAAAATGFFFGAELQKSIFENGWARIPEWTGMWSLASS